MVANLQWDSLFPGDSSYIQLTKLTSMGVCASVCTHVSVVCLEGVCTRVSVVCLEDVCIRLCVYMSIYRAQRRMPVSCSAFIYPYPLRQRPSLDLEQGQQPASPESSHTLPRPLTGIRGESSHAWRLTWLLGIRTQALVFASKHPHPLSHLSSPPNLQQMLQTQLSTKKIFLSFKTLCGLTDMSSATNRSWP